MLQELILYEISAFVWSWTLHFFAMHYALQRKDEETLMLTLIIEDLKICKQ